MTNDDDAHRRKQESVVRAPGGQQNERRGNRRDECGERGIPEQEGDHDPDPRKSQRGLPHRAGEHADIGGDPLAAPERQPDREDVAEKGPQPGGDLEAAAEPAGRPAPPPCPSACRGGALPRRAPCGRSSARWWRRYCPSRWNARRRGPAARVMQQAEGDRAQQIAECQRDDRKIGHGRLVPRLAPSARRPGLCSEDCAARHQRLQDLALQPRAFEAGVLGARPDVGFAHDPWLVEVDDARDRPARRA